jgi:hypothetical protein
MKVELRLPLPPLALGVSWTGKSLLNWVVRHADTDMKNALIQLREGVGGDAFRALFDQKAAELNARVEARVLDARGIVTEGLAKIEVN